MASGRVGGTRSKVSGQVGDTIYQIRRNSDGTYSQVVYAKGQQSVSTTTPKLQVQRMITAMVESLMKDLKEVAKISMQASVNKSKSLNAFSSFNLALLAQDVRANWYGNNRFMYVERDPYHNYVRDLGGEYLISSGTLQLNTFDRMVEDDYPAIAYDVQYVGVHYLYGIEFDLSINATTVGQFLALHRMTRLDSVVFCGFDRYVNYQADNNDSEEVLQHIYCIAQVNPSIGDGVIITEEIARILFVTKSNADFSTYVKRDGSSIVLGYLCDNADKDEDLYYDAAFSISYLSGKKKISSSSYLRTGDREDGWSLVNTPTYVFGSWIGDPTNHNYPNPFE